MLKIIESYEEFLEKQFVERENFLKETSTKLIDELTEHLKGWGWERKGKGGGLSGHKIKGVKYTKTFNGKNITIEYRNNLRIGNYGLYYEYGYNEFIHDKSFSRIKEREKYPFFVSIGGSFMHFRWNGEDTYYTCSDLDTILERFDNFYSKIK